MIHRHILAHMPVPARAPKHGPSGQGKYVSQQTSEPI